MSGSVDPITHKLNSINAELESLYKNFESAKESQLKDVQARFTALTREMREKGLQTTEASTKTLQAVQKSLKKISAAMSQYHAILEAQLKEAANQKHTLKGYLDSLHLE